ncbi:MAG: Calx-beta domain-containing protein, partial [Verrucomicrobiota bacterium]
ASEPFTSGQFTITRTNDNLVSPLTVYYAMSGTASNGVDYATLSGSATIAAGQSNTVVTVQPQGTYFTNSPLTAKLTLLNNANYGIRTPSSATVSIAIGAMLAPGVLVTYGFNENSNSAPALSAVAKATVGPNFTNEITAYNASSGSGLGNFGTNNPTGIGYSSSTYASPSSALYVFGIYPFASNAVNSVVSKSYVSFVIQPQAGYRMTLTNFAALLLSTTGTSNYIGTNVNFLRSSLDHFTSDLGSVTNIVYYGNTNGFAQMNVPVNVTNYAGPVEFRLYYYVAGSSSTTGQNVFRMDDVSFYGSMTTNPPGSQVVTVTATTPNASESGTPGAFTLARYGDTSGALTFNYAMSGTAINGVDYLTLSGSTNFGAGITNIIIPVVPAGNQLTQPTVTATLTALTDAGMPASDIVTIANDIAPGSLLVYRFNENSNSAPSLSSVAAATVVANYAGQISALNAAAGLGLSATFGTNNATNVLVLYGSSQYVSAPSSLTVEGGYFLGSNEQQSLANNDYISFVIQPQAGYRMTLTNFSAWVKSTTDSITNGLGTNIYFLRYSADRFMSDLGAITNSPGTNSADPFTLWNIPVNVTNYPGPVEFRMYFSVPALVVGRSDFFRVDDVTVYGSTSANPSGSQVVTVTATVPNASESGTNGAFTLARYGDTSGALTFNYAMSGTANNGVDYVHLSGVTNFPAGVTNLLIPVVPTGVQLAGPTATAILTALTDAGLPASDVVTITNLSVNLNPTNFTAIVSNGALVLSWPPDHT